MADTDDDLRARIAATLRHALRGTADPAGIRRATEATTEAVLPFVGRETPQAHWERRRERALALMAELKKAGKGRAAAHLVARELATDPLDPHDVEGLAQQIRRWWRTRKERNTCADGPPRPAYCRRPKFSRPLLSRQLSLRYDGLYCCFIMALTEMIPPIGRDPVAKEDRLAFLQGHSTSAYLVVHEFLEPVFHRGVPPAVARLGPWVARIARVPADAERYAMVFFVVPRVTIGVAVLGELLTLQVVGVGDQRADGRRPGS